MQEASVQESIAAQADQESVFALWSQGCFEGIHTDLKPVPFCFHVL